MDITVIMHPTATSFRIKLAMSIFVALALFSPISAYMEFTSGSKLVAILSLVLLLFLPLFYYLARIRNKPTQAINLLVLTLMILFVAGVTNKLLVHAQMIWVPLFPVFFYSLAGLKRGNIIVLASGIYLIALSLYLYLQTSLELDTFIHLNTSFLFSAILGYILETHHSSEKQEVNKLALTDPLTGVSNRRGMENDLNHISNSRNGDDVRMGFLLIDLDRFKQVNDKYGHKRGDEILIEISRLLEGLLRSGDKLVRWGGEEFAIVLPDMELQTSLQIAERIRSTVEKHHFSRGETITCSIGVASCLCKMDFDEIVKLADEALYQAKNNGRNRVVAYQESAGD